jgi:negative regulator of sigma E activity
MIDATQTLSPADDISDEAFAEYLNGGSPLSRLYRHIDEPQMPEPVGERVIRRGQQVARIRAMLLPANWIRISTPVAMAACALACAALLLDAGLKPLGRHHARPQLVVVNITAPSAHDIRVAAARNDVTSTASAQHPVLSNEPRNADTELVVADERIAGTTSEEQSGFVTAASQRGEVYVEDPADRPQSASQWMALIKRLESKGEYGHAALERRRFFASNLAELCASEPVKSPC